jgi:ribosome recycling factor
MSEEVELFIEDAKESMQKALNHLEEELSKVRAGKANAGMLAGIFVDYYGVNSSLDKVANINTPDARTLLIKPWEKSMLAPIEKAIMMANIGITPQNDGETIRLNIPMLTEERRRDLVKKTKLIGEESRVAIRNIRRNTLEDIKALSKEGVSEDDIKTGEEKTQEVTNSFIAKVDKHLTVKEEEIMKV